MAACSPASTIKTISDNVTVPAKTTLDGAVGNSIDVVLRAAAAITDVRTEKAVITLEAVIGDQTIDIVQSGGNLKLNDVILRLEILGYRISSRPKKAGRVGGKDRVTLTIGWGSV